MPDALVLTPAGVRAVRNRHHWIFSGAVARYPDCGDGETVRVQSPGGEHLGYAYVNRRCSLYARMVSFDDTTPLDAIRRNLALALALRERVVGDESDAYRICNAEADSIPGLILDWYAGVCVMQIGTLGLERMRDELIELIERDLRPRALYERSDSPARAEEGLEARAGWVRGEESEVLIQERGLRFRVQIQGAQKTGFFLDQRENRALVQRLASGRRVLDCFSYTGGFSVSAMRGGAKRVELVDSSAAALQAAGANLELNGVLPHAASLRQSDCFQFLREERFDADFVVLDPPAFARRARDVRSAGRGYGELNRQALGKIASGGLLLTCSCSYHLDAAAFGRVVFKAARDAGRSVRILGRHRAALDHPTNLFHPQTEYLKSLLLWVQ